MDRIPISGCWLSMWLGQQAPSHKLGEEEESAYHRVPMRLPLHKKTMRFVADPYRRMRKPALLGAVLSLVLLYVLMAGLAPPLEKDQPPQPAQHKLDPEQLSAPTTAAPGVVVAGGATITGGKQPANDAPDADTLQERDGHVALRGREHDGNEGAQGAGDDVEQPSPPKVAATAAALDKTPPALATGDASKTPFVIRLILPLVAGFCFGFLGSVPVAGPTSAMVLKLGIQGKYSAGLTIAFGGAISEATYAGIAFWGFGSFLAGAKFLLPVSKVLGAVMFTLVGVVFLRTDMTRSLETDLESSERKGVGRARKELMKNVLLGLTMSGINPALLATYTGAIASVYGTGMLEFTLFLAFVFALGVCCGVSTWFYLLLSLLKKYKQRLKNQTIGLIMRGMGCFLLTLGVFCAKSSFDYFVSSASESK